MKNEINKYTYRIEWPEEDGCHLAHCLEFPSLSAHGKTVEEALREMKFVVTESIAWLKEEKEPIPEPLGLKSIFIEPTWCNDAPFPVTFISRAAHAECC